MALLWDAGVNGKKPCWKKDATHSDKAKTQQSYWIWRYLIPWSFFDSDMKVWIYTKTRKHRQEKKKKTEQKNKKLKISGKI